MRSHAFLIYSVVLKDTPLKMCVCLLHQWSDVDVLLIFHIIKKNKNICLFHQRDYYKT